MIRKSRSDVFSVPILDLDHGFVKNIVRNQIERLDLWLVYATPHESRDEYHRANERMLSETVQLARTGRRVVYSK